MSGGLVRSSLIGAFDAKEPPILVGDDREESLKRL